MYTASRVHHILWAILEIGRAQELGIGKWWNISLGSSRTVASMGTTAPPALLMQACRSENCAWSLWSHSTGNIVSQNISSRPPYFGADFLKGSTHEREMMLASKRVISHVRLGCVNLLSRASRTSGTLTHPTFCKKRSPNELGVQVSDQVCKHML